jgi:hypothetical protein
MTIRKKKKTKVGEGLMVIEVRCKGSIYLALNELKVLQDGEDFQLKDLTSENFGKLRTRLEDKGFWFPFFVWYCTEEKQYYFTDGTQRNKVLESMRDLGIYKLPDKYPCVEIFAADKKEAVESILTQSSSYGTTTKAGLSALIEEYDIQEEFDEYCEELSLPDLDLESFMDDSGGGYDGDNDDNEEGGSKNKKTLNVCPDCGHEFE